MDESNLGPQKTHISSNVIIQPYKSMVGVPSKSAKSLGWLLLLYKQYMVSYQKSTKSVVPN